MESVLFNMNDVMLMFAIFECLLLGVILAFIANMPRTKRLLLSLFLLAMAADFTDTLIYWSEPIKAQIISGSVYPFFVLKVSGFVAAPALYLYVRSVLFSDFTIKSRCVLHFLPAAAFLLFAGIFVITHDQEFFVRSKHEYGLLFDDGMFQAYLIAKNLIYIGYGAGSFRLLANYRKHLEQGYSSIENIDPLWLRLLVTGFLCIWLSYFGSYLSHRILDSLFLADFLGLVGNYLNVFFITTLVVYSLVKSQHFQGVEEMDSSSFEKASSDQQLAIASSLEKAMIEAKMYLDPELTLEQLAHSLGLSRKAVSSTINRQFGKNFFEFVNEFRINVAMSLLSDASAGNSILDIMEASGFNSKSTFNRCFKSATQMTPSQYRKKSTRNNPY